MKSIGCIDYGNNNFFEVMKDGEDIKFGSHDDVGVYVSIVEFIEEVPNYHLKDVIEQLNSLLNRE